MQRRDKIFMKQVARQIKKRKVQKRERVKRLLKHFKKDK